MIVAVDIDEVCAALMPEWIARYNRKYDDTLTPEQITSWDLSLLVKPTCGKHIFSFLTPDIYDRVQPIPGALQAVESLRYAGHRVIFVTAGNADAKRAWLVRHGFLSKGWKQPDYFACFDKSLIRADVLIDDGPHNLATFPGECILIDQPHNRDCDAPFRARDLVDAVRFVEAINRGMLDERLWLETPSPTTT